MSEIELLSSSSSYGSHDSYCKSQGSTKDQSKWKEEEFAKDKHTFKDKRKNACLKTQMIYAKKIILLTQVK